MKKRLLSLLLTLCMILTLLPTVSVPALAADPDYTYDSGSKTLTINTAAGMMSWRNDKSITKADITNASIGSGATEFKSYTLSDCPALTKIEVDAGNATYKAIGDVLFSYDGKTLLRYPQAKAGTTYTVPSDVTTIEKTAFLDATALQTVNIPASVMSITMDEYGPFFGCSSLTAITVADENTNFQDIDGVLFDKAGATLLKYPAAKDGTTYTVSSANISFQAFSESNKLETVILADTVKVLGYQAFYSCTNLKTVQLSTALTEIQTATFSTCAALEEITIPDAVTLIDRVAFTGCTSLKSVHLGTGLKTIGASAFYGCSVLTKIEIPNKVKKIDRSAFYDCPKLKTVIMTPTTAPDLGEFQFTDTMLQVVYYPKVGAAGYNAGNWTAQKVKDRLVPGAAALANLSISAGTLKLAFTPANETYTATVADSVPSLTVTPINGNVETITVHGATVESGSASEAISLNGGMNVIKIVATDPASHDTKTYTVTVTKGTSTPVVWDGTYTALSTDIGFNHGATDHLRVTMPSTDGYYTYGTATSGALTQTGSNNKYLPANWNWNVQYHSTPVNGANYTLTLKNAVWATDFADGDALMTGSPLNLVLEGTNSITSTAAGKSAVSAKNGCALTIQGSGALNAAAGGTVIAGDTIAIKSGTITGISDGQALVAVPDFVGYTNYALAVSTEKTGANPTSYDPIKIATYKYFKVRPGVQYIITFDYQGGSGTLVSTVTNSEGKLAAFPVSTWADHNFNGWFLNSSDSGIHVETDTVFTGDTTIYARWTDLRIHGITFESEGGTYVPNMETQVDGTLASLPAPTKAGFNFVGWFTEANGGTQVTTDTVFRDDTEVFAHWTAISPAPSADDDYVPPKKPVIVDGKTVNIGTEKKSGSTTTLTPDQKRLTEEIGKAKDAGTVVIPLSKSATAVACLMVKNVEDMAKKSMTLSVETGGIRYDLPTAAMDLKALAAAFPGVDSAKIPFHVTIKESGVTVQGATVTAKPTEFTITATSGGKTVSADQFSVFVDRRFEVTKAQSEKITTAVVVEPDGKLRHVPTYVYEKGGKYYAVVKSMTNSVYALIQNEIIFPDVKGKWYEDVANEVGSRKIVVGTDKGSFSGDENITRAEFAAMMVRALGLPLGKTGSFTDVPADAWYAGAVATAAEYGLVKGIGEHQFNPAGLITRQEAYQMLYNASKRTGFPNPLAARNLSAEFSDLAAVSDWAQESVAFCLNNNLSVNLKGSISPAETITRGEMSALILKLLQRSQLVDVRSKL